jgi:hypothetical protein
MGPLQATIRTVTGKTTHWIGAERCADPVAARIVMEDDGFYLLRLDSEGQCLADTWHQSLDEAKAQAAFEYEITDADWSLVK